jgi:antitoxin CptB
VSGSSEGLDERRRRLLFRATHCGMKELDWLLGRFAEAHIRGFNESDLAAFERLIQVPDQQLLAWLTWAEDVPPDHDTVLFRRIRDTGGVRKSE